MIDSGIHVVQRTVLDRAPIFPGKQTQKMRHAEALVTSCLGGSLEPPHPALQGNVTNHLYSSSFKHLPKAQLVRLSNQSENELHKVHIELNQATYSVL